LLCGCRFIVETPGATKVTTVSEAMALQNQVLRSIVRGLSGFLCAG
jgi:hypothetical protein